MRALVAILLCVSAASAQRGDINGSVTQGGMLAPAPNIKFGGLTAMVTFAGLVSPGEFQFNIIVPPTIGDGDQSITASYNGTTTQPGTLITVQH